MTVEINIKQGNFKGDYSVEFGKEFDVNNPYKSGAKVKNLKNNRTIAKNSKKYKAVIDASLPFYEEKGAEPNEENSLDKAAQTIEYLQLSKANLLELIEDAPELEFTIPDLDNVLDFLTQLTESK